jgi:lysozyme
MIPTANARLLVAHFEGCRLNSYQCPAGVWTIGYGHTGSDVGPGMEITLAQADAYLGTDLRRTGAGVNELVTVSVTPAEFDALVSFAFNLGVHALAGSTLLKLVNAGRFDAAAGQFALWNHGGGQVLPGLVARRAAEATLFRTSKLDLPS